ncbi:MAG: pyridoxamine 5'-phosphate oxidase family protein [Rikenellaceae bacterium]
MDERVIKFIKKHHVLTLATAKDNAPYCANAFYAYDAKRNRFIFTSDTATRHGSEMTNNPQVAASIVWETKIVGKIQGLQLTGGVVEADQEDRGYYIKRFPYTALAELTLWAIEPQEIKYTDNTLGFGKKLIWSAK